MTGGGVGELVQCPLLLPGDLVGSLWSCQHSRGLPGMWRMSQQKSWPLQRFRKREVLLDREGEAVCRDCPL